MTTKLTFAYPEPTSPPIFLGPSKPERHPARSRKRSAGAILAVVAATARAVARAGVAVLAGLARWKGRRATYDALMRCSDRVLADIGVKREQIPLIAKGIDPCRHEADVSRARRWWAAACARLGAAREARRERLRIYRELMTYKDHELDDLRIRRSEIAGIASGQPFLRPAG